MLHRHAIGACALATALGLLSGAASAQDLSKFPDWSGEWLRTYGGLRSVDKK